MSKSPLLSLMSPPSSPIVGQQVGPNRRWRLALVVVGAILVSLAYESSTWRASRRKSAAFNELCPVSSLSDHHPTIVLQGDGRVDVNSSRTAWIDGQLAPRVERQLRFAQSVQIEDLERSSQLCEVHVVPSSPRPKVPRRWTDDKLMFGTASSASGVQFHLPVWAHWMPKSPVPLDASHSKRRGLPTLVVLLAPPDTSDDALAIQTAAEEIKSAGINGIVRTLEVDHWAQRFFQLIQPLWRTAEARRKAEGVQTEWFIVMDDDTLPPDYDALVWLLSNHNPNEKIFIGALEESKNALEGNDPGHVAFGGAGIIISHALMETLNAPGNFEKCWEDWRYLQGGDGMISHCIGATVNRNLTDFLIVDKSLHQAAFPHDASGWFQSGLVFTTLHHWSTWFSPYPRPTFNRDDILLISRAAKFVGGHNFGRRYVFAEGSAIVHLGYSVVLYKKPLTAEDLTKTEETWDRFSDLDLRPRLREGRQKRSYYLTKVISLGENVVKLEHKNSDGERMDVIWDGRYQ